MTSPDPDAAQHRERRRAWIREHHPDAGGDPETFAAGLARLDAEPRAPHVRPTVVRSRNPVRRARRWARRTLGRVPPRHLN